jgi:hypothetical protein
MEVRRRGGGRAYANIGREERVERGGYRGRRDWLPCQAVRHLTRGVDAPVGAAGPVDPDGAVEYPGQGLLDRALDGGNTGLHLPAVVACTIVGDRELEVVHSIAGRGSR